MPKSNRARLFAALFAPVLAATAFAAASPAAAVEAPRVVASIKPVHSLVALVMQGAGEPVLLLQTGASPHTYSLRPSDAQALRQAQLVVWVGEGLETFLSKPMAALGKNSRSLELADAPGMLLLPYRTGNDWEAHTHGEPGEAHDRHADHHGPGHDDDAHEHAGGSDMHVWLDPRNARSMVAAIAAALTAVDPERAELYRSNAAAADARLARLDEQLQRETAPLAGKPYIVFHDAYQYFDHRYGLSPAGSITISPDRPPSAKRLAAIRAKIESDGARCVFAEPQFESAVVRTVVEGTRARVGMLDADGGVGIPAGTDAYFTIMQALTDSLRSCLLPSG